VRQHLILVVRHLMEYSPKKWVVIIATAIWLLSAVICGILLFDLGLPLYAQILIGAVGLLSLGMVIIASPKTRCSALRFLGSSN
jgi:hypothetical protein